MRVARVMLVAAMSLAGARTATAQARPTARALAWRAPSGCPTEAQVVAGVEQTLAGLGAGPAPFVAAVDVQAPTDGRWQARLLFQARDISAERRFEAESCEAIASAAALVIALWAERGPDGPDTPAASATAPVPFAPPPPEIARVPVLTTSPSRAVPGVEADGTRFVLMVSGLLDRNTIPDAPAGGIEVAGGPVWNGPVVRFRGLAGLSYFPSHERDTAWGIPAAQFWLLDVSSRGCVTIAVERLEIGPCGGVALSIMDGSIESDGQFQYTRQLWLSLLGSAMVSWRVSAAVAVFGRGEVVVPTTRRSWNLLVGDHVAEGYEVPSYAGRGALGLELRFQ